MIPDGIVTVLHALTGLPEGLGPLGALIQAGDGNFYGTTNSGGRNDCSCGTVFELTSDSTFTILHQFAFVDGISPVAGLIQASDTNFYGTTFTGGGSGVTGTIFRITLPASPF
jgi:uncharacterized repeat protein (TIGR03803 family)